MRDIAALVFGGEPREACEPDDERVCGGQAARPGDWCQTQPGRAALGWLGAAHRARESKPDHSGRGPFGKIVF